MSVWQGTPDHAALGGRDGDLVSISVPVEPRELEALLEALAQVSFPINPQIQHSPSTMVEFPAYSNGLAEVRKALAAFGFRPESIRVRDMLAELHTA
ncbi:MAG: hypothetical protein HYR60_11965 [Acidobacteria bacterium]|nr:hypothetical protein [Acidobacteriota bacterium]